MVQVELVRSRYLSLPRSDKGVLIGYLIKINGYSLTETLSASKRR